MRCVLCLQSLQERTQAEQFLRVFGLSTEYVSHCKVCNEYLAVHCRLAACCIASVPAASLTYAHGMAKNASGSCSLVHNACSWMQAILDNSQSPYAQLLASSSLLKVVTEHSLR